MVSLSQGYLLQPIKCLALKVTRDFGNKVSKLASKTRSKTWHSVFCLVWKLAELKSKQFLFYIHPLGNKQLPWLCRRPWILEGITIIVKNSYLTYGPGALSVWRKKRKPVALLKPRMFSFRSPVLLCSLQLQIGSALCSYPTWCVVNCSLQDYILKKPKAQKLSIPMSAKDHKV